MPDVGTAMTMQVLVSESRLASGSVAHAVSPEGEDHATAQNEEALPTKVIARPGMPTQAEIDKHRIDHIPYRSWCPECVEGFGREKPHSRVSEGSRTVPLFSCDYMYIIRGGVYSKEELSEQERKGAIRVIVGKCSATQCIFAHVVPQKGVDEEGYVVEELKNDIIWLGHSRVAIRSDNEPALLTVVERTARLLRAS